MIKITKQEAEAKWDELSPALREALYSEENANVVFQISGIKKFDENQTDLLLITAGDVLMGFIPLDMVKIAEELAERIKIDKQMAYEISQEINRKIFEPLRMEIENIGKSASVIYKNPSMNSNNPQTNFNPPKTTNEFRGVVGQTGNGRWQPEQTPQRGQAIQNLENKLSGYNQESRPREFVNELTNDRNKRIEEEIPDAPFIMHEEKPLFTKERAEFRKEDISSPMSYQPFKLQDVKPQREAPISARIDLGQEEINKTSTQDKKDEDDNIKVVHYSEFRSIPKK